MKKALPLGVMDYEKLIMNNYYAVDKTMMISEFLERQSTVTLITRPRRFGKTLNMSMLAHFFDITKDSSQLFKDTKIMDTVFASEMNQWPTIFITLIDCKGSKEDIVSEIRSQIKTQWKKYQYVFENMDEYDMHTYHDTKKALFDNNETISFSNALPFLMQKLEDYYHKKVMVFIDEYDNPFIEANINGYYDEIINGLSAILRKVLKSSYHLQYAIITGIQRVAKENIFSNLNNLLVCTVKDEEFSSYFGFNEEETKNLLAYYGLELNEDVKKMYDGYRMGNLDIYNPWSIINYASRKELESYWVNTSSNTMIKSAMQKCDLSFQEDFETLVTMEKLETTVTMDTSFYEIEKPENLWGLLVNAGYLTLGKKINKDRYVIRIPNDEVHDEFKNLTAFFLNTSNTILDDMFYALIDCKENVFLNKYRMLLLDLPSFYDLKDENSYHMMLLGIFAWLKNDYEIKSNKEEGHGRCDIILKANSSTKPSFVFEFKYLSKDTKEENVKEKLKKLSNTTVEQIREKQYDADLTGDVIYIGLAHFGKQVEMQWVKR